MNLNILVLPGDGIGTEEPQQFDGQSPRADARRAATTQSQPAYGRNREPALFSLEHVGRQLRHDAGYGKRLPL